MRNRWMAIASAVLLAGLAGVWGFSALTAPSFNRLETASDREASATATSTPLIGVDRVRPMDRLTVPPGAPLVGPPGAAVHGSDRAQVVNGLLEKGDPLSLTQAFELLQECSRLDHIKKSAQQISVPTDGSAKRPEDEKRERQALQDMADRVVRECHNVGPQLLSVRHALLDSGLQNGLPEAALAFYAAGPTSDPNDLYIRPDDLGIQNWYKKAVGHLEQSARKGSLEALSFLGGLAQAGPYADRITSVGYLRAEIALREQIGENVPLSRNEQRVLDVLMRSERSAKAELSVEDNAAADAVTRRVQPQ